MLIEIFILFQIVVLIVFFTAFFTHQEIMWAVTAVLSGTLMFTSYNIEYYVYEFNSTVGAYAPIFVSNSYPYLMGINMIFLGLALVLGFFDVFDKYGSKLAGGGPY